MIVKDQIKKRELDPEKKSEICVTMRSEMPGNRRKSCFYREEVIGSGIRDSSVRYWSGEASEDIRDII